MDIELIKNNLKEALKIINSPEYDESDFAYFEGLLDEALKETEKKTEEGPDPLVGREYVEDLIGNKLTEDQWLTITEELAGRVENFINEILEEVIDSVLEEEGN